MAVASGACPSPRVARRPARPVDFPLAMTDPRPPVPAPGVPARPPALDRGAVERVLARAAELHAAAASAPADGLTEAEVLEVAREVGLAPDAVRRALVEERLRAALPAPGAAEQGLAARLAGPGLAAAARVVPGTPAAVLDTLGRWLEGDECMRPMRRLADRASWEPRRDLVGNVVRATRGGSVAAALRTAQAVGAAALAVEEGRVLVRLEADVSAGRRQRLTVGAVTAASGAAAGGAVLGAGIVAHTLLAVLVPVAVLPLLAGGVAGWALTRGHRATVARAQVALEQLLDRLERGETAPPPAPRLLDVFAGVRRALG